MKNNLTITMGRLFDGIGSFPLAARKNGIKTIWTNEIEPFPIAISKQHFSKADFYGNIRKLDGKNLDKVDIITAGSPCQDVSIAGQRAGIAGNRSGLFMEMVRIIKEMRSCETQSKCTEKDIRPRILLWENVPGVFSSNKGQDFKIILEEICKIKDETIFIPTPPKGKWNNAECILENGFPLAWRVLDAQYFGIPQRRKRVFLVADFGGESAPKILFEPCILSRDTTQSRKPRQRASKIPQTSIGKPSEDSAIKTKCYDIGMSTIRNPMELIELSPCITASLGTGGNNTPAVLPLNTSFAQTPITHSNPQYGDPCHTLATNRSYP